MHYSDFQMEWHHLRFTSSSRHLSFVHWHPSFVQCRLSSVQWHPSPIHKLPSSVQWHPSPIHGLPSSVTQLAETMAVLTERVIVPETRPNPEDAMANKTASSRWVFAFLLTWKCDSIWRPHHPCFSPFFLCPCDYRLNMVLLDGVLAILPCMIICRFIIIAFQVSVGYQWTIACCSNAHAIVVEIVS